MSGHSKWATIKRQKGVNDAKRGIVFTKLGNQIAIAARSGTDPLTNPGLAMVIEKAKASNMPMANIERAIARVKDKESAALQEVLYEGYGPGGVGVLVECATDNLNRTYPEVRTAFTKHGGNIAEKGAVSFQFERKGVLRIEDNSEEVLLTVLEAGAEDAIQDNTSTTAYTEPKDLMKVRNKLIELGVNVTEAELSYEPKNLVTIEDNTTTEKVMRLMEAIDDLDDVVATYTNLA